MVVLQVLQNAPYFVATALVRKPSFPNNSIIIACPCPKSQLQVYRRSRIMKFFKEAADNANHQAEQAAVALD
jgi:predicted secreted protein